MKWDDEYRHERPAPKESKEEVRSPGSLDMRDGFGIASAHGQSNAAGQARDNPDNALAPATPAPAAHSEKPSVNQERADD